MYAPDAMYGFDVIRPPSAKSADGGRITSKPYVASGAYIDRMSNYCRGCRYEPVAKTAMAEGVPLCPFTAFYWRFLDRHGEELARNPRLSQMFRNWERMPPAQKTWLTAEAERMINDLESL